MTGENSHLVLLRNAARQPVSALSVVEVDTVHRAGDLIKILLNDIGERSSAEIQFHVSNGATELLASSRKAVRQWHPEEGVLFLSDTEDPEEEAAWRFWSEMNLLRESWGALDCHVVFFLLPGNYRMLIKAADHLADWMPLKLHITRSEETSSSLPPVLRMDASILSGDISPRVARQQLTMLEPRLREALKNEIPQRRLFRRYYLPMLEAAIALGDFHRAQSLRKNVSEGDVPQADQMKWWGMNYSLDIGLWKLDRAGEWALKVLERSKETNDEKHKAKACNALGEVARAQRDFEAATTWYNKSLEITEKQGNEHGAAKTYHNLGIIAGERRNFKAAESWFRKSLEIMEKQGHEHDSAITYHNLGVIADERRNLKAAESWFRKSLEIKEKQGDEYGAAVTYNSLGIIAGKRLDFKAAESWFRKSIKIEEEQGNEHGAALTYCSIGNIAGKQKRYEESAEWMIKALELLRNCNAPYEAEKVRYNFMIILNTAPSDIQQKIKTMWEEAGFGELPEDPADLLE